MMNELLILSTDFSNTVTKSQIEEMATVDEFEVVKEVQVRQPLQSLDGAIFEFMESADQSCRSTLPIFSLSTHRISV